MLHKKTKWILCVHYDNGKTEEEMEKVHWERFRIAIEKNLLKPHKFKRRVRKKEKLTDREEIILSEKYCKRISYLRQKTLCKKTKEAYKNWNA